MKKKAISILMALMLVISLLPLPALADDTLELTSENCELIGEDDYGEPVYLFTGEVPAGTQKVAFPELEDLMTDDLSFIGAWCSGDACVTGQNWAPFNDGYAFVYDLVKDSIELYEDYQDYDFSGCYAYWIVDDDYDTFYYIVPLGKTGPDFTASVGATALTVVTEKADGYTPYTYDPATWEPVLADPVTLYILAVPDGTTSVDIVFSENVLAYNYTADGATYIAGEYDYSVGASAVTVLIDGNDDGEADCIQVQMPGSSDVCFAITFAPAPTFTASVESIEMKSVSVTVDGYTPYSYPPPTYDPAACNPVPLYTVAIPEGTTRVDLAFSGNVLAYNYTADGLTWLDGWYQEEAYMTGADTANVAVDADGDGNIDCIQIQTPYYDGMNSLTLFAVTFEYTTPFTAYAGETELTEIVMTPDGYTPYEYDYATDSMVPAAPVPLYTVTVPEGTETVELFFPENVLAYNYSADGTTWLAGFYEDAQAGDAAAVVSIDDDGDGAVDCIQVQTPYDADWNTTVLYAITFEKPADDSAPFTAFAGETELTEIVMTADGYTPYEYDYATDSMVPAAPVPLYTVTVPEGTETVELFFPENVLAYNYTADGTTWLAGFYEDAQAGDAAAVVSVDDDGDGAVDCIQVQTPYDEAWSSTVLYAITFDGAGSSVVPVDVTEDELRNAIAAGYAENGPGSDGNTAWIAADMMTYAGLADAQAALTEAQKETVKDDAIGTLSASPSAADAAKNIIALVALGYDPTQLTASDGTAFSAKDVLDALAFTEDGEALNSPYYSYTLPYVIMAYRLLDDAEGLQKLIALALEIRDEWMDTTWGVDGMTPFMVALAPEYGADSDVKAALDDAAEAVRGAQLPDGSIGNFGAPNAASTGLAIAGFTAIGLDPHEIKNGENSLIDGLLTIAANCGGADLGSPLDTEQGFRGLVAAAKGAGFVTYTFDTAGLEPDADLSAPSVTFNIQPDDAEATLVFTDAEGTEIAPVTAGVFSRLAEGTYSYTVTADGYEPESGTVDVAADSRETVNVSLVRTAPGGDVPESSTAVVTVRVLSHDSAACEGKYTYLHNASAYYSILGDDDSYAVTVEKGKDTARDVLVAALTHYGIPFTEQSNGYFSMIANETEMSHGSSNSGWMYLVNGVSATVAANQYVFRGNAAMTWFFSDDYANDYGSEAWNLDPQPSGATDGADEVILPAAEVKAAADAGQGIEAETKNGTVKLDAKAVAALAEPGKDVKVSVKENADGTTTVDVSVDGKSVDADVKVELPAAGDGKVLVIVDADGSETVVKKSFFDGETMYAIVPAGAVVKVVDAEGKAFVDVKDGDWFASYVAFVSSHELFLGTGADRFDPELPMSRAMLVTVLYRLEGAKAEGGSAFDDVDPDAWYAEAVAWAKESGIIIGTGTGFQPNAPATREQIAAMLYRYAALIGLDTSAKGDLSSFSDGGDTADWAEDAMAWAVGAGLFRGDESGALNPGGTATRAQVAALFERLVELIVK